MASATPAPPAPPAGLPGEDEGRRPYLSVRALTEPPGVRFALIALVAGFLGLFVALPLVTVFKEALAAGPWRALSALAEPETLSAIRLTLLVAVLVVPFNVVFGLCASWLIAKYRFPGKSLLLSLIDLPFSVSPVVSGLIFVLLFSGRGALGRWLGDHGFPVVFSTAGIVLVTTFVTFAFVVREVLPVMEASGNSEEEAAMTLGAGGWRVFFQVTLPKVKWGLVYGVILCNARTMGDFGAVSVISGHIRGRTNTMPLQVEILYNEYDFVGAFSVAALLTLLALATLVAKKVIALRTGRA